LSQGLGVIRLEERKAIELSKEICLLLAEGDEHRKPLRHVFGLRFVKKVG
jgi:hypothetical protein